MANKSVVFKRTVSEVTKTGLIFCIGVMGFEIGDKEDAEIFVDDVFDQLCLFNILQETGETRDFVREVLVCGTLWNQEIGDDTPRAFKDFISSPKFLDRLDF